MNKKDKDQFIKFAHALADVAKAHTLKYFRLDSVSIHSKEELTFDPVTIADRQAEKAMRELIELERPEDGILGEEYPPKTGSNPLTLTRWVALGGPTSSSYAPPPPPQAGRYNAFVCQVGNPRSEYKFGSSASVNADIVASVTAR